MNEDAGLFAQDRRQRTRVAGVLLYKNDAVLLQHRDDRPALVWPGAWAIFGGHVEPGESPEEAARRELQEELELSLAGPLSLLCYTRDDYRERWIYCAELPVPVDRLTLHEGQGMQLIARSDLDRYPVTPAHRALLDLFFAMQFEWRTATPSG